MPFKKLATLNSVLRIALSFVLLAGVAIMDYNVSHEANTTLFYYLPILVFSYNDKMPARFSIVFAGLAAIAWGIVDYNTNIYREGNYIAYNMFSRWVSFSAVAYVLNRFFIEKELRKTIAEQKRIQEESNKQLKTANDELNRFVGMAAHDIRNPVGAIQMTSEMLLEDETIQGETKEFIEMIQTAAANSLQILNDTLNISQIQSGTITLHTAKADYIAFVKQDLKTNEHLAQRKNQELRFESAISSIELEFDKSRMMQVINNLLTNAIKYSENGKPIIVRVGWKDEKKDAIKTEVIDQGLGIDEKYHANLFDPFTTTSNKTTGNESKTGLGLAIVKKIVELHNGSIGFTSEKGKGSAFFFTLPHSPAP